MKLNSEKAVTLLVNNINKIHVERVLDQLKSEPRLQLDYLDHLFFKNMVFYIVFFLNIINYDYNYFSLSFL